MRKLIMAALLALLAFSATAALADDTAPVATTEKPQAPYLTSLTDALAKAAELNKPVLVDFYADW